MFEAKLEKASILKRIIDAISNLVNEVNFDCTPSGISLQAMDSAHVSLVAMLLRSDGFSEYRCDRHISLGLNLQSLSKILKCAGNDDVVTIRAQDSDTDVVTFQFDYKNKTTEFALKLMAIDSEKLGIPDTTYAAAVTLPANEFQRIISSMSGLGDSIVINVTKDGVKFGIQGDTGSGHTFIKRSASADADEEDAVIELEGEDVNLTFALRYLGFFTKATPLASVVHLQMSAEVPLVVEYKISVGDKPDERKKDRRGYIRYYLAPKIVD
jgi:proliferating cell nuclear antigen